MAENYNMSDKGGETENVRSTEEEAHHFIEKQAMDSCVKKSEIAENIIKTYEI